MVMHVELQATCSALGYHEGTQYIKEPDCLETVKELIRFLRREDDTCDIRRQLGHAQILQKDLLPLVKQHHKDKPLFDTVIRLLVNLTQPVLVCFNNQLPDEKTLRQYCLEIESHLQQYKEAFVDEELFTVLTKKMTELLELDWEHRHEEDKLMLERLLVFVRNILHIPPDPATEQRTDDDASLHDQILWAIHVSGMEDLLLYVASSENERHLCMHILEIVSLMFREQSPEVLALAGVQRSMTEKEKDERELEVARAKERAQKRSTMLRFNTRHSNFGGTYVMMNTKSLSDRELIYHKSVQDADNFTLDTNKRRRKKPKNRQPIKDTPVIRRSTLSIRLGLKEFCVQFLENAYNPLMYAVKDNLVRETTQELDETYYFWSMQFFMEFCRHHSSHVDFISETLSVPTFHYIYNNLLRYYEMIMVEKKEAIVWGRRVHLALRAYQELLMTLDMMDKSNNSHLRDSARVIKSNVFYMMEFRDIFITLLNKFDESKNSRAYLKDLVETTHLFLRMLEKFTKTNNHLIVQAKKRKRRKKARKAAKRSKEPSEQQLEDMWQEVSSELSALLQGREEVPQDIAPFDAASEVDVDQQRVEAMVRIHTALRQKQAGEAVAIFRAAREVWPERNEFGSQDITAEEEFMALREIFMAPLPGGDAQPEEAPVEEEEEEENGEEEEAAAAVRTDWEQEFNFTEYLMGYAKPQILKAYVLLAADFEKNLAHTNHCVAKMLHRIGFDLGFIGMLFQASLFRVFQKLMLGALARSARFQELYKLGVHVVRKFSEVAEKNKKVFMEMLFWKGSKEAMQITEGYDYNPGTAKVPWTENDENELMRLFEDFKDAENPEKDTVDLIMEQWSGANKTRGQIIRHLKHLHLINSVKDIKKKTHTTKVPWTENDENELMRLFEDFKDAENPEKDTVDLIMEQWAGANKTRGQIIRHLKHLHLIDSVKDIKKKKQSTRVWTADDEQELESVFRENKNADDPLSSIIAALSKKRPKNKVVAKLLAMGLICDPKEVHKKRRGKGQGERQRRGRRADSDISGGEGEEGGPGEDEDSDDEGPHEGGLPSDEEMLSSPSVSGASSDDDDSSDDEGDDDEDSTSEQMGAHQHEEQGLSASASSASSGLVEMMINIVEKGYKDQVCWIYRLLTQNANTREGQDKIFSVPIVPLTEENETAMEDPVFMDFLHGLGLSPPANEQEMFWRIPAELTASALHVIAKGIELDDNGQPLNPETLSEIQRSKLRLVSSKDKKKKDRKKDKMKKKHRDSRAAGQNEKKKRKGDKEKVRRNRKKKVEASEGDDSSDNDQAGVSDNDYVDEIDNKSDDEDDAGRRKSSKMLSAAQRREALQAMLERRKVKKVLNRKRRRSGDSTAKSNEGETTREEERTPAESAERIASTPDADTAPSEPGPRSKKRVKRVMDSDSDSDEDGDRLVIDQDRASSHASPTKPAKRIRLLDSDLSDDDNDPQHMDTSALSYKSDQDANASQSQSQSQGLLDFGDSNDDEDDKIEEKVKEGGDNDESSSDDDLPLTSAVKRKANVPESFPATLFSQGTPDSEDSELDDHVPLGALRKGRKIISDDSDDDE